MKKIIIYLIKFYRKNLSILSYGCCRFYPTCSEYFVQAVEKYGVLQGSFKGIRRILRCNVFCKAGYDPLKQKDKVKEGGL